MMRLPNWVLPTGLAALVVGIAAMTRKPAAGVGDVIAVPSSRLTLDNGQAPPSALGALLPGGALVAVRIDGVQGDVLRGAPVGIVDPTARTLSEPPEFSAANLPFVLVARRADVMDIFRGPVGARKRL